MRHYWIIGCVLFGVTRLQGQPMTRVVRPRPLEISTSKTSHLVFPYAIRSADRGSGNILAEIAQGSANILRVKAARKAFPETDLTVITTDGTLYSFLVHYAPDPDTLTLVFLARTVANAPPGVSPATALLPDGSPDKSVLREHARRALDDPRILRGVKSHQQNRIIRLTGLYSDQRTLFFRIEVDNRSALCWEGQPFRFFIQDRRRRKRTASHQQEIRPTYRLADSTCIAAHASRKFVFALAHGNLNTRECLVVLFTEKNGSTPLHLRIPSRILERIVPLIPNHPIP